MSLRVWLPLNGDTKNYGVSSTQLATNSGATVNSNGKIGSCYYFNNHYISYTCEAVKSFSECSVCLWVKLPTSHATYAQVCTLGTSGTSWNNIILGIDINESGVPIGSISTGSTYMNCSFGTAIKDDKWHHLCLTYKPGSFKIYLDGLYVATQSVSISPNFNGISNIFVGGNSNGERLTGGYINDYRVYDHCLSISEVKELAKGLVAHYLLSDSSKKENLFSSESYLGNLVSSTNIDRTPDKGIMYTSTANSFSMRISNLGFNGAGTYSISFYVKATKPGTLSIDICDVGTYTEVNIGPTPVFYSGTATVSNYCTPGNYNGFCDFNTSISGGGTVYISYIKVERGSDITSWCPAIADNTLRTDLIEYDCSGYKRDLNVSGTILTDTSPRNKIAYDFNQTGYLYKEDLELRLYAFTVSFWVKSVSSTTDQHFIFGTFNSWTANGLGMWRDHNQNGYNILLKSTAESSYGMAPILYTDAPYNTWVYFAWTWDGTSTKVYRNGVLVGTVSYGGNGYCYCPNIFLGNSMFGNRSTETSEDSMSDFKLYTTAISADDISKEYHTYASIYNNQTLKACEFIEPIAANLLEPTNTTLVRKTWGYGLSAYTQENCNVTLTDNGYRIYRAPNLTVSGNGYVMWGGLVIKPYDVYGRDMLIKGHTYILKFHVKGQSSNGSEFYWTNQCGWGGGGLEPSPDNVSYQMTPSNFQGEMECFYKWTINDDVWKVCTNSYSGFTAGNTYLSYRDFKYGFTYDDTGSLGTDLYITDIRMYDITAGNVPVKISTKGVCYGNMVEENFDKVSFNQGTEVFARQFVEI